MQPIVNIAIRAARQANEAIIFSLDKRGWGQQDVESDIQFIEHLEKNTYQIFFDALKKSFPKHYIVGPGEALSQEKEDSWHISTLHGSENLLRGLSPCGYSVVHKHNGKVQDAILVNPLNGDEFSASKGKGAELNGHRTRCSSIEATGQLFIATDALTAISTADNIDLRKSLIEKISGISRSVHNSGCSVMDIANVSAGKLDAAILLRADREELDAAHLLCLESGLLQGQLDSTPVSPKSKSLVIANPRLFKLLVQQLAPLAKQ